MWRCDIARKRTRFVARRKALGYSQEQLAEHVRVERSTVARWESGETAPQPWFRPKLARVLQLSLEQLDELLAEGSLTNTCVAERLDFALKHPTSADLVTVAQLRRQVQQLDERYDRAPSASLLADAGQCLGRVGFLSAYATSGRVRRELYAVEAEAATLMGQLVWDASQRRDHATAHMYFDQAVIAAREFPDPVAEGLALLRKSFVALYGQHDPCAGLDLTAQTAETTMGTSHVLTGLATLHAAEAHAMLGQQRSCEQALTRAEVHFDQIDSTDAAIDLFSPTQFGRLAGSCYLFLKDAKRAQPILEETARSLHDRSKSQAIVLGNLTLACIRQGNLDEATIRLHEAIDVIELTWGGGGLNIVFGAGRELRPWRHVPVVQDVYDRLLSLMAAA
jgi:transcriptional regulator with XRE-family HTH domain